jgi:hypothetical protein
MFRDLPSMYNLELEFQTAPLRVKIKEMRSQLELLKSLDNAPLFGPGVHQMDGNIGALCPAPSDRASVNPSRDLALNHPAPPPPPPPAPGSAGRGLLTKHPASTTQQRKGALDLHRPPPDEASIEAPPMPAFFGKGTHHQGAPDSFNPQDLWAFTFRLLHRARRAMGNNEIANAYAAHLESQGCIAPKQHRRKWERNRLMLRQMYELAGVKVAWEQGTLKKRVLAHWTDFSGEVLARLTEWLQSGLAHALPRDKLPAEAVSYIHSTQKKKGLWWPDHGIRLDMVSDQRRRHGGALV